jgi:hypothetical protein
MTVSKKHLKTKSARTKSNSNQKNVRISAKMRKPLKSVRTKAFSPFGFNRFERFERFEPFERFEFFEPFFFPFFFI